MKIFKKIVQIICTLLVALSLTSVPVMAEGETITVKSYEQDKTYAAYQIFTGEVSGTNLIEIQWGSGVDKTKLSAGVSTIENIDGITKGTNLTIYGALTQAQVFGDDFKKDGEQLTSAAEVADQLDKYTEENNAEKIATFAKIISYYLSDSSTTCATHETAYSTDSSSLYSHVISVNAPGYYFVKETGQTSGSTTVTSSGYMMIQVLSGNADINTKAESPQMIKKVKEDSSNEDSRYGNGYSDAADYTIGDMVTYRLYGSIVSDLTNYKNKEGNIKYTYEFVDMYGKNNGNPVFDAVDKSNIEVYLAKGANIDNSANEAKRYYELVNEIMNTATASNDSVSWTNMTSDQESSLYTLVNLDVNGNEISSTDTTTTVGGFKLSITKGPTNESGSKIITDEQITTGLSYLLQQGYRYCIVQYKVKLNSYANVGIQGNTNTAYLKYSNDYYDNDSYTTTPEDTNIVFTYQLDGSKIDGETKKALGGATFNLYYKDSNKKAYYATITDNKVTGWTETQTDAGAITSSTTDGSGKGLFKITGLDEGTYYLKEAAAPTGYNKLNDEISFKIDSTFNPDQVQSFDGSNQTSILTALTIQIDKNDPTNGDVSKGTVSMTIENYQGVTLPSTGGEGISKMLYIAGGIMVIVTGVYLLSKRRADALK